MIILFLLALYPPLKLLFIPLCNEMHLTEIYTDYPFKLCSVILYHFSFKPHNASHKTARTAMIEIGDAKLCISFLTGILEGMTLMTVNISLSVSFGG